MRVLFLLLLISFNSYAQKPLTFTDIVKVDSTISKNVLFERGRAWLNDVFKDYKEVSQIQDKESGELSIKGIIFTHYQKNGFGQPLMNYPCYVRFKLSIWVKDGRYKYEFSDYTDECVSQYANSRVLTDQEIIKEKGAMKGYINAQWKETKDGAISQTEILIASLKIAMAKEIKTSEW